MVSFGVVLVVMALLAASFLFLPAWKQSRGQGEQAPPVASRDDQVLDLFNEHVQDLERQREQGVITQVQFDQVKSELELALLDDMSVAEQKSTGLAQPWLLWVAAVVVPVASLWLYTERGAQADLEILDLQHDKYMQDLMANHEGQAPDPAAAIALRDGLVARLADRPDNLQNRYMLARVAVELEEYPLAIEHYGYILAEDPQAVKVLAEMAQVVFLAAGNRVTPEVSQLVSRALTIDPADATALGLAGIEAYQANDLRTAAAHWNKALLKMDPASGAAQSLRAGVMQVQRLLAEAGGEPLAAAESEVASSSAADQDEATIVLDVSLAEGVPASADQVVYVYARAWQGAPLPLAIARVTVADLPLRVSLTESMAMAPGMTITSVEDLELVARISSDGTPRSQSGDWQASLGPVRLAALTGATPLLIEKQLP